MKTGLDSLDTGAPKITYSGNEGPQAPQQMAMADPLLIEEYQKYVFEMEEQGLQPMSFEEFRRQAMSGMAKGGVAMQGGGPNYLGKQPEVTVPRRWKSSPDHPDTELAYITEPEKKVLIALNMHGGLEDGKPNKGPKGVISLQGDMGSFDGPSGSSGSSGSGNGRETNRERGIRESAQRSYSTQSPSGNGRQDPMGSGYYDTPEGRQELADQSRKIEEMREKGEGIFADEPSEDKNIIKDILDSRTKAAFNASLIIPGQTERIARYRKAYKEYLESMGITPPSSLDDEDLSKFYVDGAFTFEPGPARKAPGPFEYMQPDDVMNYGDFLLERFNNPTVKYRGDMGAYKREMGLGGDGPGITSQYPYPMSTVITPPGMEPIVTPPVETKNPFVPGSGLPFANYYVGANPNAAQLAYGQQMGVDPRMYGLTAYAADGGRIGYAGGGIADLRQGYFLGKLVKKIGRGIKKVVKSPIGKAALLAAPFAFKGRTGGIGKIITDALFGKVTGAPVPGERIGGLLGFAKKKSFCKHRCTIYITIIIWTKPRRR